MPLFRATIWHQGQRSFNEQGFNMTRSIYELSADSEDQFKYLACKMIMKDHEGADVIVVFGPVSQK